MVSDALALDDALRDIEVLQHDVARLEVALAETVGALNAVIDWMNPQPDAPRLAPVWDGASRAFSADGEPNYMDDDSAWFHDRTP